MKALVLDGDTRAALSIVRSLGGRGVEVAVAAEGKQSLAGCSRWASEVLAYPCPRMSPLWFVNWLVFTLQSSPATVIYTCSDVTTSLVGKHRAALPSSARLLMPSQTALETALDKHRTLALARQLEVPVPNSIVIGRDEFVRGNNLPFSFPVAVKACQSDAPDRSVTLYPRDEEQLRSALRQVLSSSEFVLVQEIASGEGTALFALFDSGEPVATFAHRRIHEKPPWGGVSVLSQSIDPPQDMLDQSLRLLRKLRWHGVAMVEFKRDKSGKPLLLEVNPRFWGSLELAVRCGVDFPYLALQVAIGKKMGPVLAKDGANRWLIGELDSLIAVMRYGMPARHRMSEALRRLWDLRFGLCCEVERLGDPRPALYEYSTWLKTSVCRVSSGLKGDRTRCGKPAAPEG